MNMAIISCSRYATAAGGAHPPPRHCLSSPRCGEPCRKHARYESRRVLLIGTFLAAASSLDKPTPDYPPKSPLIEQLLERSRANKAKNDKQRLDSYYERNYKEYFEFVEGTIKNKTELTETEKGILNWLDKVRSKKK